MTTKLEALETLLWAEWDPISVNDIPEAWGEYDAYAGPLLGLLEAGADAGAVAEYLDRIVTDRMGLTGSPARSRQIAERAVALWAGHTRT